MKNLIGKSLVILVLLLSHNATQAQRLGKLLKDASRDISTGVTDKLAEKLVDKLADKIVEKFSARIDTILQEAYVADTTGSNGTSVSYIDFLANMDESDKVSEAYRFDMATVHSVIDDDGNESLTTNYYTKDGSLLGIKMEEIFMVLDAENHIMVTFNLEDKSAYAFGESLMKYSSKLIPNDLIPNYVIQNSGENKSILGYSCNKYIGESDNGDYIVYVAQDFPIDMENAYKSVSEVFFDGRFNESFQDLKGIALESIFTEENGEKTHSTAIEIDKSGYTLNSTEFTFSARQ